MALDNWQLDQLIGRVDQQRWLEHILRENIPERRGRTIVITGPFGSGRAALARFGLWQSLYALPRSIEIHAVDRTVRAPQDKDEQGKVVGATVEALKDVGQRLPFPIGPLFTGLVSLWSGISLEERQQRLVNIAPSPQSLLTLVEDTASAGPFALHITGLDDPSLDEQWIDAVVDVAKYIHERYPVLVLLSTTTSQPLAELEEWQMTPIQRRLRKLLDEQIVETWHLASVSVEDVQSYVHEPADEVVIRRLHELSGGWPLMVQTLWQNWRSTAAKDKGGGKRNPILAGDGFAIPWHFTPHGLSAMADVSEALNDLLDAYPDALEKLAPLLDDDEKPREVMRYVLSVATLEGKSFTGMAVAHACELPWEDGLEEVFDALFDAGLLIDDPNGYDEVPSAEGTQRLYRYRFVLPIWWHLFHEDPNFTDEERREAARDLAQALEECYGSLAWRRIAEITSLWEQAGEFERVRFQRRFLDQLAYIGRLRIRAELAEQSAQRTGAWLNAHRAWLDLAMAMRGYVDHAQTFATFEHARAMAEHGGGSSVVVAKTLSYIANYANIIDDWSRAEKAANEGLAALSEWQDAAAQRQRARLLHELGVVHYKRNELDVALSYLEQARVLEAVHDIPASLAATLHEIGRVHFQRNEYDTALDYYEQARVLKVVHDMPASLATTLHEIGRVHFQREEWEQALEYLEQARVLEAVHGTPAGLANILRDFGAVYFQLGKVYLHRGLVCQKQDELDFGKAYLEQARVLTAAHGSLVNLATTLKMLGGAYFNDDPDRAEEYLEQARVLMAAHGTPVQLADILHLLASLYDNRKEHEQALAIREQGSDQEALAWTLYRLAEQLYLDRGECQAALKHVRRALDVGRANNLGVADVEVLERRILEECQPSSED